MTAVANSIRLRSIHGNNITSSATMPRALGTKVSVCSWMEVTDWKMLMASPMSSAVNKMGAASVTASSIRLLSNSVANSGFIKSGGKTLHDGADHQVPAVHQHEQKDFQGERNRHRRHHHHAHAHQDRGHDEVNQNKRHENEETHLKGGAQFADDKTGNDDLQRQFVGRDRAGFGQRDEKLHVLRAGLL